MDSSVRVCEASKAALSFPVRLSSSTASKKIDLRQHGSWPAGYGVRDAKARAVARPKPAQAEAASAGATEGGGAARARRSEGGSGAIRRNLLYVYRATTPHSFNTV